MCVGYIQIQAILHKGLEHPWVLVFTEILVPIPLTKKSVIWEQLDGRDASGKVCGKGHRAPMLTSGATTSQRVDVFPTWKFSESSTIGILWRLLHIGMINY